MEDHKPYSKG